MRPTANRRCLTSTASNTAMAKTNSNTHNSSKTSKRKNKMETVLMRSSRSERSTRPCARRTTTSDASRRKRKASLPSPKNTDAPSMFSANMKRQRFWAFELTNSPKIPQHTQRSSLTDFARWALYKSLKKSSDKKCFPSSCVDTFPTANTRTGLWTSCRSCTDFAEHWW